MSFDPVVISSLQPENAPLPPVSAPKPFRNKTWQQAEGSREVSARLAALPAGVQFLDDFAEPIRYDAARRLLLYRGFMTNTSFVELQRLSRDLDFARALEHLFTASAQETEPKPKSWLWVVTGAIVLAVIAAIAWRALG